RSDGRRARAGVEQRQLSEHLTRTEDREEVLAAVGGGAAELHLAVDHDVQPVAGVALMEQHVTPPELGVAHRPAQGGGGLVVERAEQRRLTQYLVVHDVLLVICTARPCTPYVGRCGGSPAILSSG